MPRAQKTIRESLIFAALLLLSHLFMASAEAQLVITPAALTVRLDGGERPKGALLLSNPTDKLLRYRVKAINFTLSEGGGLKVIQSSTRSLSEWLRFNPKEFELPPGTKRSIRYSILTPKDLEVGEYWCALEFEPLIPVTTKISREDGRNFNINVVTSALATIFAQKGEPEYKIDIASAELHPEDASSLLTLRLKNSGTAKIYLLGGEFELINDKGDSVEKGILPEFLLMRDGQRKLKIELASRIAAGNYSLKIGAQTRQTTKVINMETQMSVTE